MDTKGTRAPRFLFLAGLPGAGAETTASLIGHQTGRITIPYVSSLSAAMEANEINPEDYPRTPEAVEAYLAYLESLVRQLKYLTVPAAVGSSGLRWFICASLLAPKDRSRILALNQEFAEDEDVVGIVYLSQWLKECRRRTKIRFKATRANGDSIFLGPRMWDAHKAYAEANKQGQNIVPLKREGILVHRANPSTDKHAVVRDLLKGPGAIPGLHHEVMLTPKEAKLLEAAASASGK